MITFWKLLNFNGKIFLTFFKGVRVKKRYFLKGCGVLVASLLISGCAPTGGGSGSWSDSQVKEFEAILAEDRYSSLCDLGPLYQQYLQTKDKKLLNKLLYNYVKNLANSCIDLDSFERAQERRKAQGIKTHYSVYLENVSSIDIFNKLSKGEKIESILAPYIPPTPQFNRLIDALNSTSDPASRKKIKLNIERTKIMDPNNWDTYVLINVPEYKFRLFENGTKVMEFKVIVGKYKWQTPIFSSTMKYIVINPTWNVPDNIARKEIIPHLVKDPVGYLKRHNMVVRRDYNIDSPPVDPRSVNWKKYLSKEWENKELPYKLIERASTRNALGQVKFMFPNRFSVYMHDTNKKYLFNNVQRSFSHGCIRLEKPFDLLRHISTNYTATPIENPKEYLALLRRKKKRDTTYINLVRTIPVHIVYLTAYVDEDGVVRFFNDIYRYDAIQHVRGLGSI